MPTHRVYARRSAFCTVLLLTTGAATSLRAQTCYGTPPRGGVAVDVGKVGFGTTTGATGAYAGNRIAFGAGFRTLDRGSSISGTGGDVRFALVLGSGRLQVCPGLGFEFEQSTWNAPPGTLKSSSLTGWGGIGAGFEQPVYRDFNLIPFASVRFAFTVVKYDFSTTNSDVVTTGDTLSRGEIRYGLLGRYKIAYLGFIADHPLKSAPPFMARWVIGLTLPVRE